MFPIEHEWILVFGKQAVGLKPTVRNKSGGSAGASSRRGADGTVKPVRGAAAIRTHRELGTVVSVDAVSETKDHPAQFPVGLSASYISSFDGAVYDPFLGSGTTMVAAEQLGRICYGIEISPAYCGVILQRMKDCGMNPRLDS